MYLTEQICQYAILRSHFEIIVSFKPNCSHKVQTVNSKHRFKKIHVRVYEIIFG